MATLNMQGSYPLTKESIDKQVTRTSAGNYALGYISDERFIVEYVGRSDDDLNRRLKEWVGSKYKSFKYSYAPSRKAAYEKECENYHDFGGSEELDNDIHPDKPNNTDYECPVCEA